MTTIDLGQYYRSGMESAEAARKAFSEADYRSKESEFKTLETEEKISDIKSTRSAKELLQKAFADTDPAAVDMRDPFTRSKIIASAATDAYTKGMPVQAAELNKLAASEIEMSKKFGTEEGQQAALRMNQEGPGGGPGGPPVAPGGMGGPTPAVGGGGPMGGLPGASPAPANIGGAPFDSTGMLSQQSQLQDAQQQIRAGQAHINQLRAQASALRIDDPARSHLETEITREGALLEKQQNSADKLQADLSARFAYPLTKAKDQASLDGIRSAFGDILSEQLDAQMAQGYQPPGGRVAELNRRLNNLLPQKYDEAGKAKIAATQARFTSMTNLRNEDAAERQLKTLELETKKVLAHLHSQNLQGERAFKADSLKSINTQIAATKDTLESLDKEDKNIRISMKDLPEKSPSYQANLSRLNTIQGQKNQVLNDLKTLQLQAKSLYGKVGLGDAELPKPKPAPTVKAGPDQSDINALKEHPEAAAEFDKMFGTPKNPNPSKEILHKPGVFSHKRGLERKEELKKTIKGIGESITDDFKD